MLLQLIVAHYKEDSQYVERFLDSIDCQDFIDKHDIEVLIVNDGNEVILPESLLNKYNFSIKYLIKEWGGLSDTRQYGLDNATADYVMFCDCDDMFSRIDALYKIIDCCKTDKYDFISCGRLQDVNNKIEIVNAKGNMTTHEVHSKIFRLSFLKEHNIFWNKEIKYWGDYFYFSSILFSENPRAGLIDEQLYIWKSHQGSITNKVNSKKQTFDPDNLLIDRYFMVLAELNKRNNKLGLKNKLVDTLILMYEIGINSTNSKETLEQNLKDAQLLANLYTKEILTINKLDLIQRITTLKIQNYISYLFAAESFTAWWHKHCPSLQNWLI